MNALTPADVLDKAANVIEARGWNQGDWDSDSSCGVCVLAAINVATGRKPDDEAVREHEAVFLFADHLGITLDREENNPIHAIGNRWNDEDGRTAEEVVSNLRACAADLRAKAS